MQKNFVNKFHLVLQISKIPSQNFAFLRFCVYVVGTKQTHSSTAMCFSTSHLTVKIELPGSGCQYIHFKKRMSIAREFVSLSTNNIQ